MKTSLVYCLSLGLYWISLLVGSAAHAQNIVGPKSVSERTVVEYSIYGDYDDISWEAVGGQAMYELPLPIGGGLGGGSSPSGPMLHTVSVAWDCNRTSGQLIFRYGGYRSKTLNVSIKSAS
ncbi:MAG: hypothetical protein AAF734_09120, partial [Bacteroidota bacterium]